MIFMYFRRRDIFHVDDFGVFSCEGGLYIIIVLRG
jgi:hypothetical protein